MPLCPKSMLNRNRSRRRAIPEPSIVQKTSPCYYMFIDHRKDMERLSKFSMILGLESLLGLEVILGNLSGIGSSFTNCAIYGMKNGNSVESFWTTPIQTTCRKSPALHISNLVSLVMTGKYGSVFSLPARKLIAASK